MQSVKSVTHETNTEQQLVTLREHLLALSRTEGQLKELRDKASENVSPSEYSIVEVLELWQQIFQETFQHYHRLSSRLVQSEDSSAAIRLWREYLQHVQSFLANAIPEDYDSLSDHRHLCEVHRNLLASQQSVLALKNESKAKIDPATLDQFNALTNLHNETLSRIIDRHSEIEIRLSAWDKYRDDQARLLEWLKEREKERSRLQLRYIHLRRVPKVLHRIEGFIEHLPQGEADADSLRRQQTRFLHFCDDTLVTSIRMEHASISQRISNLRAALETWRDFLKKIIDLGDTYESKVKVIQANCHDVQAIVTETSNAMPSTAIEIQERLRQLRDQRVRLNNLTTELEAISVIQEELKECVSPFDMKTIRQMVWILWQQQADLDQQLQTLINQIEERLSLTATFLAKYERLMQWMDSIEKRMDSDSNSMLCDPEDLVRRLEKELRSEMELREREREWLLSSGRELISFYSGDTVDDEEKRLEVQLKLDNVVDRWERLKYLCKSRSNKIYDLKMTMIRLEERISAMKSWLHTMEVKIAEPLAFEDASQHVIDERLQDHDKLQRAIESECSNVGEVLNLCEMLLSDVDTWKAHFNTTTLTMATENLERRWKNVCSQSAERKRQLITMWQLLQEVITVTNEQEDWMLRQEKLLIDHEYDVENLSKDAAAERIRKIEQQISDIESHSPIFKILEQSFSKLVKASGLKTDNIIQLVQPAKTMLNRWRALSPKAMDIIGILNMDTKMYREFVNLHGKSVITLTQIDAELTQLQHILRSDISPADQLRKIRGIERNLQTASAILENADKLGLVIMQKSSSIEISSIQTLIDEYQTLWRDIQVRLGAFKSEVMAEVPVDEEIQVETLRFETDSAVQVNTLPGLSRMTSITPKDAYLYELLAAIKECRSNLDDLENSVNDPTKKPGSQVVSKLISNSQSSVELMNHLSSVLITECFCTNEEAEVAEVSNLCAKYGMLVALWKARERQQLDNR